MPNREKINSRVSKLLLATVAGATTAQTSAGLDSLGFDAASFNIHAGATAPAPTSIVMEESDDGVTYTAVSADEQGGRDAIADWAPSKTLRLAYVGGKRHSRVVVTPNGATDLTITGELEKPSHMKTDNPA